MKHFATIALMLIMAISLLACGGGGSGVAAPSLESIAITPSSPKVSLGSTQQLMAMGTYTDGATQAVPGVTWNSASPSTAARGRNRRNLFLTRPRESHGRRSISINRL